MLIALISDIHGNIRALEAVLADAQECGANAYIFLGDYIFDMPYSNKVARLLMGLENARCVAGNKEGYLNKLDWADAEGARREQTAVLYQTYNELDAESLAFLRGLPLELTYRTKSGKTIYAAHTLRDLRANGKSRYNSSYLFGLEMLSSPFTRAEFLRGLQAFYEQTMVNEARLIGTDVIAYGHNHIQGYGRLEGRLLVDAGACGMPMDLDPRPAYTLIDETREGFAVIERRVAYDIDACISEAMQSECHRKGRIWSESVYESVKQGRDCASILLREAMRVRDERKLSIIDDACMLEAQRRCLASEFNLM